MWTSKNRARYDRSKLRYPSDLSDDKIYPEEGRLCNLQFSGARCVRSGYVLRPSRSFAVAIGV